MTDIRALMARLPYGRGDELRLMMENGEQSLAVHMVIENLYEFELSVSEAEVALLRKLAARWGLDGRALGWLDEMSEDS